MSPRCARLPVIEMGQTTEPIATNDEPGPERVIIRHVDQPHAGWMAFSRVIRWTLPRPTLEPRFRKAPQRRIVSGFAMATFANTFRPICLPSTASRRRSATVTRPSHIASNAAKNCTGSGSIDPVG